jgi:Zn-dependent peptidase ImmA (M78 family)
MTIRFCQQCGNAREPFFDSTCEEPVAWLCQTCGSVELERDASHLSSEAQRDLENLIAFMRAARPAAATGGARAGTATGVARARVRARALIEGIRDVPVDIQRIAEQHGHPVRERALPGAERGTIARDGDHTVIVVAKDRLNEAERRWVIAEELGHAILEHSALVASTTPGAAVAVAEPRRMAEEREAKTFAAEILMPEQKLRGRFAELAPRIYKTLGLRQREAETDEVVVALARMFGVTPTAMRLRLEELELLR